MWVRGLTLSSFRNFKYLQTALASGVNIIHGDNAQGKTNFLEALFYCATGRSSRAANERELISFGCETAYLRAEMEREGSSRTIDVGIRNDGARTYKSLAVDRVPIRRTVDLYGLLLVVMFSPEDLRLVKAGPAERRAFMDMEICQLSPVYCHDLKQYHHALKQRNALLKELQKGEGSPLDTLSVWDEQLCNYGRRVMEARKIFVERAGTLASETHAHMTGGDEKLSLQYLPNIKDAEIFKTTLEKNRQRDIALGSTAAGAHKDDIKFLINENDARVYGSQGQQRTAALSAKLAGIEIIKENTGTPPVLLLDDVLSELDGNRQAFLLSRIEGTQTLLTCTGMEDILKRSEAKIMKMVNGTIQ